MFLNKFTEKAVFDQLKKHPNFSGLSYSILKFTDEDRYSIKYELVVNDVFIYGGLEWRINSLSIDTITRCINESVETFSSKFNKKLDPYYISCLYSLRFRFFTKERLPVAIDVEETLDQINYIDFKGKNLNSIFLELDKIYNLKLEA